MLISLIILCALLYLSLLGFKTAYVLVALANMPETHSAAKRFRVSGESAQAEVTIVQPLLSGDPRLPQVLATNLQTLPEQAFLWLIDRDDAVAQQIAAALRASFPAAQINVLLCDPAPDGINPKAWKLELARPLLQTAVCLVLDDDATLPAASLRALVQHCPVRGIVTALPHYQQGNNLPSQLLAQFVNNNAVMTYLPLLPFTTPVSINGMCYALRRDFLQQCGGFAPVLQHLTDDLAMAELCRQHDGNLLQLAVPVEVQTSVSDMRHYRQQMHRWMVFATLLLQQQSKGTALLITLLQGIHPLLLWILLLLCIAQPATLFLLVLVLVMRSAAMMLVQKQVTGAFRHRFGLSLLSELLQPLHLLHALRERRIRWRSRVYQVKRNDQFHVAES